jgi:hypothetical protein
MWIVLTRSMKRATHIPEIDPLQEQCAQHYPNCNSRRPHD